jgi:hypothetical protein
MLQGVKFKLFDLTGTSGIDKTSKGIKSKTLNQNLESFIGWSVCSFTNMGQSP